MQYVIQMVMAVFSYIYYQSFIAPHHYSVESFLDQVSTPDISTSWVTVLLSLLLLVTFGFNYQF